MIRRASVFPTGAASLNSRSIRCTSDDLAYGVTTAMSVLIYRRFGGSGPRYLSSSLRSLLSSLSFSRALWRLSFPFALIRHFLPCSAAGRRAQSGKRLKKDRASRPLDRSTEGRRTLGVRSQIADGSFSFFLSFSPLLSPSSMLLDDDDSGYHRRRNSCAMTRRAHFTRARAERKRHEGQPRS